MGFAVIYFQVQISCFYQKLLSNQKSASHCWECPQS